MTRSRPFLLALSLTILTGVSAPSAFGSPSSPAERPQVLVLDARIAHARAVGPGPRHVGHRQILEGILRDTARRRVGTFSVTCTWTKVTPQGALEHCVAAADFGEGRLDASGRSNSASDTQVWAVAGGTDRYRGARGELTVLDLGPRESLLTASITPRPGVVLRAGRVARPAANDAFLAAADRICDAAARRLATLPPFPIAGFDPLHPEPAALPAVGAFFTGPGDPRPTLRNLLAGLRGLGDPAAARRRWRSVLAARERELAIIEEQDRAALADDVPAFVRSVRQSAAGYREVAVTATVFGAPGCAR